MEHREKTMARMTAFFDAVLAIAITLLILEFSIPSGESFGWAELDTLMQPITNLVLSFFVLASVWIAHSRYFNMVSVWDQGILTGHLVVIFLAAVFPKTTSLFSMYPESGLAFGIYMGNFVIMYAVLHATGLYAVYRQLKTWGDQDQLVEVSHYFAQLPLEQRGQFRHILLIGILCMMIDMVLMVGACALLVSSPLMCYFLFALDGVITVIVGRRLVRAVNKMIVTHQQSEGFGM